MLDRDWPFFSVFKTLDPVSAYSGKYDLGLVATSLVIAILAAFVALSISGRIAAATARRARWAWASAGAISMGGGIWAMHFIGMLAFTLPCGIAYDPVGTVLSMIPGMLASGIALGAISKPARPNLLRLTVSATLMGVGIGAMHYSGMAAMRPEALLRYDPGIVLASVVVAVALAFASLSIHFRFHRTPTSSLPETIVAASVMGCAVAGMHYTAMQASVFYPLPDVSLHGTAMAPTLLALLIAIFTVLIASCTLVAAFAGRQNELALSLTAEVARRRRIEEDLVRSREQAEAASLAKSEFLATMSHEIRTPMNGVLGMASLLASTPLNEHQRRLVENLSRSGQALRATITDILDVSKIESGQFVMFEDDFDVREVVAEVIDLFGEPCASKGLELVYFVAEEVPSQLRGDPVRLRQVLINLVGNAVKFTERGEILVEATIVDRGTGFVTLGLSVQDTGIGIAAEERAKVFESFHQADHTMTRAHGGSGLGLTIARHLVGMMGGDISVESELGRGSCFRFTARLGRSAREADTAVAARRVERPLRLLLVDAHPVSARVMSLYLATWGIDATVVATTREAEAAWNEAVAAGRAFNVATIDVKGLGAAGVALARTIRRDGRGRPAEIIALVGIDGITADESLESLDVFATLTKPARPSELFNCLVSLAAAAGGSEVAPFFMRRSADAERLQFDARILVAEDNAVNREVAVGMLEAMGCRVETVPNGEEAVELFARERFDLILMDCEMPLTDGFAAAGRIREMERVAAAPPGGEQSRRRTAIVAVTAHALTTVHQRCLDAGMDDFLVKPFDEQQLGKALRRWIGGFERAVERSGRASPAVPAAIDAAAIEQIRAIRGRGDGSVLTRVVSQFAAAAPSLTAAIRAKSGEGDAEAVWRAAHSLRSSAAAIGAHQLSRRCAEIERAAREKGVVSVLSLLDPLDADLAAATLSLQKLI